MTSWEKYAGSATGWSERQYADAKSYLRHRAELVRTLGPLLVPGDTLLDLACGDGGLADFLPEQRYVGVDASAAMVDAGRARGRKLVLGDLGDYEPPERVAATTIFRAIYYARDRRALLARIAGYTEKKLVFDVNPRQYRIDDICADLRAAGFRDIALHPFFVPQTHALPRVASAGLRMVERSRVLAAAILRWRFTYFVAASGTNR